MDSEQHHYELRSRSRSRSQTPSVLNRNTIDSETVEHHYDLRSKSPERSHTPEEVTSSRRSGSRSLSSSASKLRDKSKESVVEQKEKVAAATVTENQGKQSDSPTFPAAKKVERRSERQRVKRQIFANGQNEINDLIEKSERRTKSLTPRRVLTSDYSSEEGEREDPPSRPGSAYEIYKQAGDWWNVFPKTDYTYSQKSQYRYEIAPGVLAMPNMSRRSIHSDSNSTGGSISISQQNLSKSSLITGESFDEDMTDIGETRDANQDFTSAEGDLQLFSHNRPDSLAQAMIYKTTHVEHFKSHREIIHLSSGNSSPVEEKHDRYLAWTHSPLGTVTSRRYGHVSQVDSDTELDEVMMTSVNRNKKRRIALWFGRLTIIVAAWYTRMIQYIGLGKVRRQYTTPSYDYRRYHESKWSKAWRPIDRVLQQLYLLLVKILFLDTWLLSRVSNVREQMRERRSKILWIVLLPPLLLAETIASFWFYNRHCSNRSKALGFSFSNSKYCEMVFLKWEKDRGRLALLETRSDGLNFGDMGKIAIEAIRTVSSFVYPSLSYRIGPDMWHYESKSRFKMKTNHLHKSLTGWWFLPYTLSIAPFHSIAEVVKRTEKEVSSFTTQLNVRREELTERPRLKEDELRMIISMLTDKIEKFEDNDKMQLNKFTLLEKRLAEEEANIDSIRLLISTIRYEFQTLRKLYLQLRSCDASMKIIINEEIKKHVERVSKQGIAEIMENLIVASNGANSVRVKVKGDSMTEGVEQNIKPVASLTSNEHIEIGETLTKEDIREIVKQMLKIYDADKTGRVDYALESAGGQIISTRCTQHYNINTRAFKLLGFTLYYENINPRIVIQRNPMQPGVCWVFQDFPGYLLIKLRSLIYVTGFTMEHAPRSILPNGEMKSAPRKFNVWGLKGENDREPVLFGDYEFVDSDDNLQYFSVLNTTITTPYEYVELKIHSNHGQLDYTCLYRFRVHGVPV